MITDRDRYLDYLKAIAIIWVVLVHVFYSKQFVPLGVSGGRILMGVMLFEMPVLFFVTGANLYHSHRTRPSIRYYLDRRARRLLGPYFLLAFLCGGLFYAAELTAGRALDLDQIVSWLLLRPWPVVPEYIQWFMWFIRVMVGVSLVHVILVRLFTHDRLRAPTAIALAVGVVAFSFVGKPVLDSYPPALRELPQYVVFYGAFAYIGYYYAADRLTRSPRWLALTFSSCLVLLMVLVVAGVLSPHAQVNKFPPNAGYALLGLSWLALWLFLRPAIVTVADRMRPVGGALRYFSSHSYSVYLYHGIAFWITDLAFPFLRIPDLLGDAHYMFSLGTYYIFALGVTAVLAAIVDWLTVPISAGFNACVAWCWSIIRTRPMRLLNVRIVRGDGYRNNWPS